VDTTAVVFPKFILDVVVGENANLLKPTSGIDAGKIHGWMIGRASDANTRTGSVRWDDSSISTSFRLDSAVTYRIWFFHYYAHGSEASDTDSAELFSVKLDAVIEALAKNPRLAITTTGCGVGNQIKQHRELQVENEEIVSMAGEWAHWAQCSLTVDLYRTPAG
jgi:hypothetical protein